MFYHCCGSHEREVISAKESRIEYECEKRIEKMDRENHTSRNIDHKIR